MSLIVIPQRFAQRIDTAANWAAKNSVLYFGEIGYETVPGGAPKEKVGDGVTAWNGLSYTGNASPSAVAIPIIAGIATLDWAAGEFFTLALTQNATLALTNPPAAGCAILRLTQTGAFMLAMPGSVNAIGGATYATTQVVGNTERLGFLTINAGTSYDLVKG